jgi:chemotaxis signal transduction protein
VDVLYFQLDGAPYAFPLPAIADVAPAGHIHAVPLSPPAILGLAECRGRAIAVIDLPSLLNAGNARGGSTAHLMRLTGPLHGAAFLVPSAVFSGRAIPADAGHVFIDGHLHVLLDPEGLVKRAGAFD